MGGRLTDDVELVDANNNTISPTGGVSTGTVASAAANTVILARAGKLCRVLVTTAGTGTGSVLIYDNATTNSGTVIGVVPATIAIGTIYEFLMPCANGIVVANVTSGPVLTVSFE